MLPELSVDGFQASVTVLCVRFVAWRFVGVVGGVWSPVGAGGGFFAGAAATKINAKTSASAAPAARRPTASFPFMSFLPVNDALIGRGRCPHRVLGAKRAVGLVARKRAVGLVARKRGLDCSASRGRRSAGGREPGPGAAPQPSRQQDDGRQRAR